MVAVAGEDLGQKADAVGKFLMKGVPGENRPYLWAARALFAAIIVTVLILTRLAWKKKAAGKA
mgnify:CR=1 FL=1